MNIPDSIIKLIEALPDDIAAELYITFIRHIADKPYSIENLSPGARDAYFDILEELTPILRRRQKARERYLRKKAERADISQKSCLRTSRHEHSATEAPNPTIPFINEHSSPYLQAITRKLQSKVGASPAARSKIIRDFKKKYSRYFAPSALSLPN